MGCSFLPSISAVVTTVVILPLILFGTTIIPCVVSTSIGMEDLTGNQIDIAQQNMSQYNQFQINDNDGGQHHYTDQWAVHVLGGSHKADQIAVKHGFVNTGEILPDFYHFVHERIAKRSIEPCHEYHQLLSAEPEVRWHEQQKVKRRSKRDFLQISPKLSSNGGGGGGERSGRSRTVKRSRVVAFNDPRWPAMWYLNRGPGLDMNVNEAWGEGITGKGIVVTILDDGLEKDHPDIVRNYDPMASFDVNSLDMDPMPTYDLTDSNRHGTRCAGEVAAEANNSICAVGVAYEASVGGVRMLDGDVTDAVEARSLSHNPQHIDIYSASWGPDDDGKTVDGPGELATRAFIEGVSKGRGGRGSIFVWASGNGGRDHDNCNCDGYTNSIWTLSISSATENGLVPWYSEACSSTLATTYSSGGTGEKQIVTIDLHHSCTSSHTGTSASAPLAAGICALALQANTNLTWRDMQHIVVRTARPQNLIAPDWATNGVGRNVSHSFGYGLMDAGAMVKLAKRWKTVAEQNKCEVRAPYTDKNIPAKSKVTLDLKVTNCDGVNFLEHVQAKVTLTSGRRGDLQIYLVSPSGTRSTLLAHRRHDLNRSGFTDWPFMTVHSWGENPIGKWTLEIHNEGRYAGRTVLKRWSLIVYGTEEDENSGSPKPTGGNNDNPSLATLNPPNIRYPAKINLSYLNRTSDSSRNPIDSQLNTNSKASSNSSSPPGSRSQGQGKSTVINEAELVVTTTMKKPARQRQFKKLLSKKQKGVAPPPGSPSQRPSIRLVTESPNYRGAALASGVGLASLVGMGSFISGSGGGSSSRHSGEEHKLFFSTKFGNQSLSQTNETMTMTMSMSKSLKEKEISLNPDSDSDPNSTILPVSSSSSSETSLTTSSTTTTTTIVGNSTDSETSSSPSSSTISPSSTNTNNSSAQPQLMGTDVKIVGGGGGGDDSLRLFGSPVKNISSSSLSSPFEVTGSSAHVNSNQQNRTDSSEVEPNGSKGKLQTWTLVAHGIAASPNESDIENGSTKVVSPGEVIAKVPGADGRGTNTDTNGNVAGAGQQPVVEFDGSENSIVIQPSQVHDPPLGVETGDAVAGVPLSTSSASSSSSSSSNCAKMSMNGQCLDCLPGLALLHGICLERCPDTFYSDSRGSQTQAAEVAVSTDNYGSVNPSYVCLPCHYSCKLCSGPNEFECLSCHSDASLHVEEGKSGSGSGGRNESHCYPVVLLDTLNSNEFWYKTLVVTVLVNVCFVAALLIYIWFQRRVSGGEGGSRKRKPHLRPHLQRQSYRRISPDEDHPTILNVNVGSGSEDEDEEESDEYSDRHREDNDNNHLENYPSHHQHSKLVVKNPYLNSLGGARGSGGDSSSNLNIENKNHFPSAAPVTEPQSRLPASSIYSKSDELFS